MIFLFRDLHTSLTAFTSLDNDVGGQDFSLPVHLHLGSFINASCFAGVLVKKSNFMCK